MPTQVELWLSENRELDGGGRRLRSKESYPITFDTLFADVRLKCPRYYLPHVVGGNGPATIYPLRKLIPDHIATERLYLETRWPSLVPYSAAAELLADVLTVESGATATTVRQHALQATSAATGLRAFVVNPGGRTKAVCDARTRVRHGEGASLAGRVRGAHKGRKRRSWRKAVPEVNPGESFSV